MKPKFLVEGRKYKPLKEFTLRSRSQAKISASDLMIFVGEDFDALHETISYKFVLPTHNNEVYPLSSGEVYEYLGCELKEDTLCKTLKKATFSRIRDQVAQIYAKKGTPLVFRARVAPDEYIFYGAKTKKIKDGTIIFTQTDLEITLSRKEVIELITVVE